MSAKYRTGWIAEVATGAAINGPIGLPGKRTDGSSSAVQAADVWSARFIST
ncbi:hypothetical protein ACFYO1_27770 [Nocardia sp. NPDC006044]|uniref:hypothetical protein n=1 Tax=Nocardia sp. NPDC006044 TaxID=3364306 RepID=UPI0036756211